MRRDIFRIVSTINSMPRTLALFGWMAAAAAGLYGLPPTTGAQYWSTDPNLDCSAFHALIIQVPLASGGIGLSCLVSGTFPWLAAGGGWSTSIRAAAPASGAIGVDYGFFEDGQRISLDTTLGNGAVPASGNVVSFALNANQPSEIRLLGATSSAPQYGTTQTGFVYARFFCPDAATCATVIPQLLYSFAPIKPWSLSVPILWDSSFSSFQPKGILPGWSASGISDATPPYFFRDLQPVQGRGDLHRSGVRRQRSPDRTIHDTIDSCSRHAGVSSDGSDTNTVASGHFEGHRRRRVQPFLGRVLPV